MSEQRYRLEPHARFRVLDDEGIFVLQQAGEVVVVNKIGAFVVEQLRAGQTVDDVVEAITELYQVEAPHARNDVEALIQSLLEIGALGAV